MDRLTLLSCCFAVQIYAYCDEPHGFGHVHNGTYSAQRQEMAEAAVGCIMSNHLHRIGSANRTGHYKRSLVTRVGKLELRVPRHRYGRFSTELFERYQRSQQALG